MSLNGYFYLNLYSIVKLNFCLITYSMLMLKYYYVN